LALAAVCAILAVGLGLRLEFAAHHFALPTPDSRGYARIAESLYERGEFGRQGEFGAAEVQEPTNYSPGTPLLVAGVYGVTGGVNPLAGRVAIALIGGLGLLFTYLLGRRLGGPWVGLLGAVPVSFYPALLEYHGMFMSETIALTTVTGAALAFVWAGERGNRWAWALPGLLLGLTALTRPEYLIFGPVFAFLALFKVRSDHEWRSGLAAAGVLVVAFALPILPWTVRNLIVLDRFVPLSTGGGKALFIGTYLPGDGLNDETKVELLSRQNELRRQLYGRYPRYRPSRLDPHLLLSQRLPPTDGVDAQLLLSQRIGEGEYVYLDDVLDDLAAHRHPDLSTDSALAKMGRRNLEHYASSEPLQFGAMIAGKVWHMWRQGPRRTMQQWGWIAWHGLIVALAVVGLGLLARRRRWETVVLGVLPAGVTATGALLLSSERRVLVLIGVVSCLAAYAVVAAAEAVRARLS
jgi:dolichyl-phosphate-mannose-protein mannosyltransferase